jgi:hypothetical protein
MKPELKEYVKPELTALNFKETQSGMLPAPAEIGLEAGPDEVSPS